MIHGPEEKKKTQGSQRVIVRRLNPSSSTNQRVLRSMFPRPDVATVSHFAVFVDVDVQLQDSQAAARGQRKAVIRDISGVDHWGVTNLSAPMWFTGRDRGIAPFFVTWCNYHCWFCVGKALWRWFYPRSRKRDHFQTLATGVPKLKTWLGTQRVSTRLLSRRLYQDTWKMFTTSPSHCLVEEASAIRQDPTVAGGFKALPVFFFIFYFFIFFF